MRSSFVVFIAFRYFREKKRSRKIASSIFSITGISVGIMTLITVIGVMNGFQLSFIEPIINIGSYHIQISGGPEMDNKTLQKLRDITQITAVVPFSEIQALVEGKSVCIIRGISPEMNELDPEFKKSFDLEYYDMPDGVTLAEKDSIIVGSQLAIHLGIKKGDYISLTTFTGEWSVKKKVTGYFQTWYYEIDRNWAFFSLDSSREFFKNDRKFPVVYGVKLKNRFGDQEAYKKIRSVLGEEKYKISSWREFNRNFFNALLMEKLLMMLLIGLIFIVVGFNIFHSLKRSVVEKKEEIAILKALGAHPDRVKNIFILEGFFIGFFGSLIGLFLGLFVANNINTIFSLFNYFINDILLHIIESILSPFFGEIGFERVSIFSPDVFYIKNVPIRILLTETLFIVLFAILCSSLAAYFASKKVIDFKPAEILRYE